MATAGTGQNKSKAGGARSGMVPDKTRIRVEELARAGEMSRNAIAKLVGISPSSVSRICKRAEPPILFQAKMPPEAVAALEDDLKARRARISSMAVTEVERLFTLLTAEHEVIHWDREGFMHRGTISSPTSGDVKNYATTIGILLDKHAMLTRFDSDDRDLPAVDKWLAAMVGGAQAFAGAS